MEMFFTILILILIVFISKIIIKMFYYINIPLSLFQIFLGILLSYFKFGLNINFNPELFLLLFIPPLLFFDGLNININNFLENSIEIILLALILVFFTVFFVSILIYYLIPNISFIESIILSAVLSPTDAVSLFNLGNKIPKKIMTILQGEALMNDASGLVSLKCAIAIATGCMIFTFKNIIKEFIKVSIGGILIGIIIAIVYKKLLKFISYYNADDETNQIILLLILPFMSYLTAEYFNLSGILSSVISGMIINKFKIIENNSSNIKLKYNNVLKTFEFILNGVVFIILGLQMPIILNNLFLDSIEKKISCNLSMLIFEIIIIYLFLIFLRFIWILFLKKISIKYFNFKNNFLFSNYNIYETLIISFSGVRGSITLAAILSTPITLGNNLFLLRNRLIFISAGVILLSLIVGVIILPIFLKKNYYINKNNLLENNNKNFYKF